MGTGTVSRQYPAGIGWVAGYLFGVVCGIIAWVVSGRLTVGLILFVATGTALGVAFEQSLATRPLTTRERRLAWALLTTGVVGGVLMSIMLTLAR